MPVHPLSDDGGDGWRVVLHSAPLLLLFKHSPWCGASAVADRRVRDFSAAHPDVPVFLVDVIAQRDLSRRIATALDVGHESPQVILIRDGRPVWNTSHFKITGDALVDAIARTDAADQPPRPGALA